MEIKDDGTQTFTCKIPKFYLSEMPNERIINPRWQDAENGILAENTRVLKISIQFSETETKVFPFIIDKIVNKRDNNFSVYKEITGNGLAFAELGKQGYKIELNSTVLEQDFAKDDTTLASIDYWLDKVFPNEKDENGVITKWLTPWCYEIRMDWRGYFDQLSDIFIDGGTAGQIEGYSFYNSRNAKYLDKEMVNWLLINAGDGGPLHQPRDESIIYENPYVENWDIINNKLSPIQVTNFREKARYVDCYNSNKYNITQTLAETFEVYCTYEYACDPNGHFKKTYWDDANQVWTGKKVVFFNRAIKTDKPYVINYEHNLNTISRTIDSSEVYTKMYVNPIASETMDTGYVSIADTSLNPLLDDFILNFDYLYKIGSINDFQKNEIEAYKIKIHKLNKELISVGEIGAELAVQLNELESLQASAKAAMESAQEQLKTYEKYAQSLPNEPVLKGGKGNGYPVTFVPKDSMGILQASLRLEGINVSTIQGYSNSSYDEDKSIFPIMIIDDKEVVRPLVHAQNAPSNASSNKNSWYVTKDEYGFPDSIFTSKDNDIFATEEGREKYFGDKDANVLNGVVIYLSLEYFPKNKYETICNSLQIKEDTQRAKYEEYSILIGTDEGLKENWFGLKKDIKENEETRLSLLAQKEALNFKLERTLGPALREGYWQPESYEDPGEGHNVAIMKDKRNETVDNTTIIFDEVLFEEEQKEYYYASSDDIDNDKRTYYSFIQLPINFLRQIGTAKRSDKDGGDIKLRLVSDFCITLMNPEYTWTTVNKNTITAGKKYYVLLDGKYYTFEAPTSAGTEQGVYPAGTKLIIHTVKSNNANTTPYLEIKVAEQNSIYKDLIYDKNFDANKIEYDDYYNLTGAFLGANQYLSSRHLYNDSGFKYAFFKDDNGSIIPIILLIQDDIDYQRYKVVKYSFDKGETIEDEVKLTIENGSDKYKIVYPRIFIDYRNVNTESENFKIYVTPDAKKLINYEDYQILERKGRPYVTLKVSDRNFPSYLLEETYNIIFQVSRANEQLYLDAKQVAKDSSKPKYSYEIQIANIPDEVNSLELGQLCHINDYSIDVYKEYGYISGLTYVLDKPQEDTITVANYKTKFEDLFSSISAQSEAMKQNQNMYNIAAASFTSSGEVQPSVLQSTLDNNNIAFNFSDSNLRLDDTGGLVLTNKTPYSNGVFGQIAVRGGGLFCSSSINDETGERNWETAVTPIGINANLITTGQLDTRLIRIMSGDQAAFQWNNEGLYAYKSDSINGTPTYSNKSYVKMNEDGLLYMLDGVPQLELGWQGFQIKGANGHVKITSNAGLQMVDEQERPLVTFGKYGNQYGMFFTDLNGNVQLQATQTGKLQLIDTLKIGSSDDTNYAGLCGTDAYIDSVTKERIRIWAGSESPTSAEFTVGEGGAVKARRIFIENSDGSKSLELTYDKLEKLLALI